MLLAEVSGPLLCWIMTRLLNATHELTAWADVASASHRDVEKHFRSHRAAEQEELSQLMATDQRMATDPAVCVVASP
jgi:hypothetical protein